MLTVLASKLFGDLRTQLGLPDPEDAPAADAIRRVLQAAHELIAHKGIVATRTQSEPARTTIVTQTIEEAAPSHALIKLVGDAFANLFGAFRKAVLEPESPGDELLTLIEGDKLYPYLVEYVDLQKQQADSSTWKLVDLDASDLEQDKESNKDVKENCEAYAEVDRFLIERFQECKDIKDLDIRAFKEEAKAIRDKHVTNEPTSTTTSPIEETILG